MLLNAVITIIAILAVIQFLYSAGSILFAIFGHSPMTQQLAHFMYLIADLIVIIVFKNISFEVLSVIWHLILQCFWWAILVAIFFSVKKLFVK